jgi:hypothetical protein
MNYFTKFYLLVLAVISLASVNICSAQGDVTGYVIFNDNYQPVTDGTVKAYDLNGVEVASAPIQSNGSYLITINPIQEIDIIGIPNHEPEEDSFAPTIHPDQIDWQTAAVVYPTSPLTNVNIYVTRIPSGNMVSTFVKGNVTLDNRPVKDAVVYALLGGTCKNFGITDSKGDFVINSIPVGNYILGIHRVGANAIEVPVSVTISGQEGLSYNITSAQPKKENITVRSYKLTQNYPNPFNPVTTIKYDLPKSGNVKLSVYNTAGQLVAVLVNELQTNGSYSVEFDASNLASGVYFYRLDANGFSNTKKMILVK